MKYLSIIYYDSFARFFSAIEDAVRKDDKNAEFLHLAIFPSGWLFMKAHGRNVRLLPWEIRKQSNISINVDDDQLEKISHYHAVIGAHRGNSYRDALRERAFRYVNTMGRFVEEFHPDAVLFSGDTRIACEALKYYLDHSRYKGKRYYFEQGPNGTTIFDSSGVNANCSFRESAAHLTGEGFEPETVVKQKKYKRNPLFRATDYAVIAGLRLLNKVPPEWDTMSLCQYSEVDYSRCIEQGRIRTRADAREILVALQVPDDANNIHHNPLGLGDAELLQWVLHASDKFRLLVRVREHPLYRRRYTSNFYELVAKSDRVLLSDASLEDDLASAAMVVTVNSMTGLDAYLRKIPVIVLGNAFYDHLPGIERARDEAGFGAAIVNLASSNLAARFGSRDPACIFAEMRAKHFIPGHYQDLELRAPHAIAEILAKDLGHGSS